ncbi:SMI1/KNR4 family protein [Hymenobacter cellulosivorans]|uniref:SMI1/KNR4 family protein n=1 Tax=Hymenobacter cellulosivorans TaxID=2932249 RepID=A0ABY4F3F6_9BACT|nr:SMI1/KNR4 family protein [Hymenobacter cellulosivorans]UOQ51188.1 SMI1/KNR4 family protein [Hymenobacter cellulosivorans]
MRKQSILHEVQAGKAENYYRLVTDAALYYAVAGFLPHATRLLQALWHQKLPHSRHVRLQDQAFAVLWQVAGLPVPEAPFRVLALADIEWHHRGYLGGDRYAYPMPAVEWAELRGKNAFRQAQTWFSSGDYDPQILVLIQHALQQPQELAPYELCDALCIGAEVAAKTGNEELVLTLLHRWAPYAADDNARLSVATMASSRHVAPLLLRGVLAADLNLTAESCQQEVTELIAALTRRLAQGPQPLYAHLAWPQLLAQLNQLALAAEPDLLTDSQWPQPWIGREPASAADIAATEQRLGLELPADYKAFLQASNGLVNFSGVDPELLPVAEINWYKQAESAELYAHTQTYPDVESDEEQAIIGPYLERAVLISSLDQEQLLWLIAPTEPSGQWQTWFFAAWQPGETRYPTFRAYVEEQLQALEQQDA